MVIVRMLKSWLACRDEVSRIVLRTPQDLYEVIKNPSPNKVVEYLYEFD